MSLLKPLTSNDDDSLSTTQTFQSLTEKTRVLRLKRLFINSSAYIFPKKKKRKEKKKTHWLIILMFHFLPIHLFMGLFISGGLIDLLFLHPFM